MVEYASIYWDSILVFIPVSIAKVLEPILGTLSGSQDYILDYTSLKPVF